MALHNLIQLIRYTLVLIILIISSAAMASFELKLESSQLSQGEIRQVNQFMNTTEGLLPRLMKNALARKPIKVKFEQLNDGQISDLNSVVCGGNISDYQLSKTRRSRLPIVDLFRSNELITLDNSLLAAIINGGEALDCSHGDSYKYAQGALIRELAIIFDRQNIKLGQEAAYQRYCRQFTEDQLERFQRNCKLFLDRTRSVSQSPYYRNLSGWIQRGILIRRTQNLNHYVDRSPNPLEFENTELSFATNLEFHLLDPSYQCRRPTLAQYFTELFDYAPYEADACQFNTEVTIINQRSRDNTIMYEQLDPERLYQVQYLFASKGERMSSRWGHSLFKLVFCAPHREEVGPDCLYDRAYHIVLSFRANVEGFNIDYLDGLTGNYDSIMLIQPLSEVIEEYNKGEFRDLLSVPLNMTDKERTTFLKKALEVYWSYKGQYYFISNNCATEALNLMKTAMPNNFDLQHMSVVSPRALYRRFIANGIFDGSVLDDMEEARDRGHYFPAFNTSLERSFTTMKESNAFVQSIDLQEYSNELTALERREIMEEVLDNADEQEKTRLISNMLRLEDHIQSVLNTNIQSAAFQMLMNLETDGSSQDEDGKDDVMQYIERFQELYKQASPENNVLPGYGVPTSEDFARISDDKMDELTDEAEELYRSLSSLVERYLPERFENLKQTVENRAWLIESLMFSTGLQ